MRIPKVDARNNGGHMAGMVFADEQLNVVVRSLDADALVVVVGTAKDEEPVAGGRRGLERQQEVGVETEAPACLIVEEGVGGRVAVGSTQPVGHRHEEIRVEATVGRRSQMGQARWASTGTARKSTAIARHDTIVLVPARGTIWIVPRPQVRPAALARARHD
jgi:hypothetical protein